MHVEATATTDLMVTRMNADPRTGRFDIAFELPGSAMSRRLPLRFTGTAREMTQVATLTRSLRQGETKFLGPRMANLLRVIRTPVLLIAR